MHKITVHSITPALFGRHHRRKFNRELPESWDEVPASHIPFILQQTAKNEWDVAKVFILQKLLSLPRFAFLNLTEIEVVALSRCIEFMQEKPGHKALIQSVDYKGTTYYFPKEGFSDGIAFEYPVLDEYLQEFVQSGNEYALYKMAGLLLRPHDAEGNRMPAIDRGEVERMSNYFKELPQHVLSIGLRYAIGVTHYVHRLYNEWLFAQPSEDDEQVSQRAVDFGWWGVFMDIGESGVFGNYKDVLRTSFHDICVYLVKKKQEAAEQRDRFQNPNTKTL